MAYKNLVKMQEDACKKFGSNPMFGSKTKGSYEWITFAEFGEKVDEFRSGLAQLGVSKGDKVAIIAGNSADWAIAAYATYGLGGVFVPMYEKQAIPECQYIVADCDAKVLLVTNDETKAAFEAEIEKTPSLKHIVTKSKWPEILASGKKRPKPSQSPSSNDIQGLIYTSGTTGKPKGVLLSHGNILANLEEAAKEFSFNQSDRMLSFLPWAHIFAQAGELHLALRVGFSVAFNKSINELAEDLAAVKPTVLIAVPRIFQKIHQGVLQKMAASGGLIEKSFKDGMELATRKSKGEYVGVLRYLKLLLINNVIFAKITARFGGRLRFCISGAAALNSETAQFMTNLGIDVYEGYGLSETSPIISCNTPKSRKLGSVGKVVSYAKVNLDHSALGDNNEEGEIVAYGPMIMQGYLNRPDDTKAVMTDDGGFRTGDIGRIDKEGYLYITGRIKEQYKLQNGKYIVPTVLEEKLKTSPYISQALVSGANKNYNVALIVPEMEALTRYAKDCSIPTKPIDKMLESAKIIKLFEDILEAKQKSFKGYEKIRAFKLVAEEWTPENGMLTQTLKVKRREVIKLNQSAIESLYGST